MIRIKYSASVFLAIVSMLASSTVFADNSNQPNLLNGDPIAGKTTSQICQGCHGIDGNSSSKFVPKLSGQFKGYIEKQMRNYLAGTRSHELMNGVAAQLSDKDLADIAAYFASQTTMTGNGEPPNKLGEKLFLSGDAKEKVMTCAFCHGKDGKGISAEISMYPVVGGQHKVYLLKQLKNFRDDNRYNSPSIVMNRTVRGLNDGELEALAEFMSEQ